MTAPVIEVLCVGTELLLGATLNTNLLFLGQQLEDLGLVVSRETCIPDTPEVIAEALAGALSRAQLVITIGGLGPTADDLTRETVAAALQLPLVFDESIAAAIRGRFAQHKLTMRENILRQAHVPQGAEVLTNDHGTAPGLWCAKGGRIVAMLPGPPSEFRPMVVNYLVPRLARDWAPTVQRVTISVCGVPESHLEQRVQEVLVDYPEADPAYCVSFDHTTVRLTAPIALADRLQQAAAAVRAALGPQVVPNDGGVVAGICQLLRQRNWRLATAESCTGGGIGAAITDQPGVSDVYLGGVVTYANELKHQLLGVSLETLAEHGAVSAEAATEMVRGLTQRYGAEAGIAVTGVAGPDGGTADKPVGTVFIATIAGTDLCVQHEHIARDRAGVRVRTVYKALNQLRRQLLDR